MALDRLETKIVWLAPPNGDKNYFFVTMMITNSQGQTDMQQRGHKNCLNRQRTRHPFNKYSSKKERKKTADCGNAHHRTNISLILADREQEDLQRVFEKRTQKLCTLQVGKAWQERNGLFEIFALALWLS